MGNDTPQPNAPQPNTPQPSTPREDEVAKWLAGGFAIVVALTGTLGITAGGLTFIILNNVWAAAVAFFLVVLAIGIAIVSYVSILERRTKQLTLLVAGSLFVLGLLMITFLGVRGPTQQIQPSIAASFKRVDGVGLVLVASIKVEHVPARARPQITVNGLHREGRANLATQLYFSLLGPDAQGTIDRSVEVPIPPGQFQAVGVAVNASNVADLQCDVLHPNQGAGCVTVTLPLAAERPQIIAGWDPADRTILDVRIDDANLAPGAAVGFRIIGRRGDGSYEVLASGFLLPGSLGVATTKDPIRVPVEEPMRSACVAARVVASYSGVESRSLLPSCPPRDGSTVWVQLRVPG